MGMARRQPRAPSARKVADGEGPGLVEVVALGALYGYVATSVFATHARLPAAQLYRSRHHGLAGGVDQLLTFLGHPVGPAAIAVAAVAIAHLPPTAVTRALRRGALVAGVAAAVCPFAVRRAGLEARGLDLLAVFGVVLAGVLTVEAARVAGVGRLAPERGDAARLVLGASVLGLGLPWLFADLGVFIGDVPLLGVLFLSYELLPEGAIRTAVHLGHHHGLDGMLLVLTALALSRVLARMRATRLRAALSCYLALLLVYGAVRAAQDFWFEQVVRRGWADFDLPHVVEQGRPAMTSAWAGILLAATLVHGLWFQRIARGEIASGSPAGWFRIGCGATYRIVHHSLRDRSPSSTGPSTAPCQAWSHAGSPPGGLVDDMGPTRSAKSSRDPWPRPGRFLAPAATAGRVCKEEMACAPEDSSGASVRWGLRRSCSA